MTDEERDTRPWATITHVGPDGKEWDNVWIKNSDEFSADELEAGRAFLKKAWFSSKDKRDQYISINGWRSKEEREADKPQPSKW